MARWKCLVLGVLALSRQALCSAGDRCYIEGALTTLLDNRLYFVQGNYSIVTYDGQSTEPSATLYYLDLDDDYPVERNIPESSLNSIPITSNISAAYKMSQKPSQHGALWQANDTLYFLGGGYDGTDEISSYNVSSGEWANVQVKGGNFNKGNRTSAQSVSIRESGLSFIMGGNNPYINGMLRFDASDPNNLSWTNETLNNGSYGVEVPNLNAAYMVYIPASTEGMLIAFGGGNYSDGISPYSGFPYEATWNLIYVYDIASHTWWEQEASGEPPKNLDQFCAGVTESPDSSAFHITTYGGWSLTDERAYEDVYVLSIPSFQWIDATKLSNQTNREQRVNSTIGRSALSSSCQVYRGSQLLVLGGNIRSGAYSLTDGACSNVFEPTRVLDLATYEWEQNLNTSATYQVPSIIYNEIGGGATGGATVTAPSAGFADATLASLISKRVPSTTTSGSSSSSSSGSSLTTTSSAEKSSHTNTGAIAGGVVGGVVGLALIIALAWYSMTRRRKQALERGESAIPESSKTSGNLRAELYSKSHAEMEGTSKSVAELYGQHKNVAEMQGENKYIAELR